MCPNTVCLYVVSEAEKKKKKWVKPFSNKPITNTINKKIIWLLKLDSGDVSSYLSLSSKTLLTNPHWPASLLSTFLAVKQSSLTKLWLPISFGKRCRAPTSAHKPLIGSKRNVQKVSFFLLTFKKPLSDFLEIIIFSPNAGTGQ